MSGRFISLIAAYGTDGNGKLTVSRQLVFPMLRTVPNDTHASTIYTFGSEAAPVIRINNRIISEQVKRFMIRGMVIIESSNGNGIDIRRELFPSTDKPAAFERYTLTNNTKQPIVPIIQPSTDPCSKFFRLLISVSIAYGWRSVNSIYGPHATPSTPGTENP